MSLSKISSTQLAASCLRAQFKSTDLKGAISALREVNWLSLIYIAFIATISYITLLLKTLLIGI